MTLNEANTMEELINALMTIYKTPAIRDFLKENDPMAYGQVRNALVAAGKIESEKWEGVQTEESEEDRERARLIDKREQLIGEVRGWIDKEWIDKYIQAAEHTDGLEFWDNFNGTEEFVRDIKMFIVYKV